MSKDSELKQIFATSLSGFAEQLVEAAKEGYVLSGDMGHHPFADIYGNCSCWMVLEKATKGNKTEEAPVDDVVTENVEDEKPKTKVTKKK